MKYIPRLIEEQIKEKLSFYGAISIEGCKWCGKSTTARQFARSFLELQNPDSYKNSLELRLPWITLIPLSMTQGISQPLEAILPAKCAM